MPGRVLLDPNKLSADGTAALSGSSFTDDGKLWAYGVAIAGSDRTSWKVMNVETGEHLRTLSSRTARAASRGSKTIRDSSTAASRMQPRVPS